MKNSLTSQGSQHSKVTYWTMAILFLLSFKMVKAQDNILLKNGIEINAKVIEISDQHVRYRKVEDNREVTLSIPKADVFMIKYGNGITEVFESKKVAQPT